MSSSESRKHIRLDLFVQVQVSVDSEVHIMATSNMSRGGAFILANPADHPDIKVGTELDMVIFTADDLREMNCKARVVHIRDKQEDGRGLGFGVSFSHIPQDEAPKLDEFLKYAEGA
ncbi:MAG: PilZ domain-containing protein [Pseudomonadota bacterium]